MRLPTSDRPDAMLFRRALERGTPPSWVLLAGACILLLLATGLAGYWQLFSSFAGYDDEGYVLLSLRTFLSGRPLYDETYSQYGPAFYILEGAFHGWGVLPVSHDVARLKTLTVWLLSAVMFAAAVWKLTGRVWLSLLGFAAAWLHLDRLGLEPGHPQDLALPLMLGMILVASPSFSNEGWRHQRIACWLGALCGTLCMVKLNLGVLAGLGCSTALAGMLPTGRGVWCVRGMLLALVAGLPFALAGRHVASLEGAALPFAVLCGAIGVGAVTVSRWRRREIAHLSPCEADRAVMRSLFSFAAVAAGTAFMFAAFALAHGTSLQGLWYGLVGQHRGFLDLFYHHPPLPGWSLIASAGSLLLLWFAWRRPSQMGTALWICPLLLLTAGLRNLEESCRAIEHGLDDRGGAGLLAAWTMPFVWVLWPGCGDEHPAAWYRTRSEVFGRRLLCLFVLLQPLGMYPTPGTQSALGTLPALMLLLVGLSDLLEQSSAIDWGWSHPVTSATLGWGVLLFLSVLGRDAAQYQRWSTRTPLELPGAHWLRLPMEEVRDRQATTDWLRRNGDCFFATPSGCCSLYLWAELTPPTTCNATFWEVLLNTQQQTAVIESLESANRPLLVVDRGQSPVKHVESPLHQYLEQHYSQRVNLGRFEIRERTRKWNRLAEVTPLR